MSIIYFIFISRQIPPKRQRSRGHVIRLKIRKGWMNSEVIFQEEDGLGSDCPNAVLVSSSLFKNCAGTSVARRSRNTILSLFARWQQFLSCQYAFARWLMTRRGQNAELGRHHRLHRPEGGSPTALFLYWNLIMNPSTCLT